MKKLLKIREKAVNKYLSPFVSAYRQNYSTHHVLIRLLEQWGEGLDNDFLVEGAFMDLSKAFDCIPNFLVAKFQAYGFEKYLVHYI